MGLSEIVKGAWKLPIVAGIAMMAVSEPVAAQEQTQTNNSHMAAVSNDYPVLVPYSGEGVLKVRGSNKEEYYNTWKAAVNKKYPASTNDIIGIHFYCDIIADVLKAREGSVEKESVTEIMNRYNTRYVPIARAYDSSGLDKQYVEQEKRFIARAIISRSADLDVDAEIANIQAIPKDSRYILTTSNDAPREIALKVGETYLTVPDSKGFVQLMDEQYPESKKWSKEKRNDFHYYIAGINHEAFSNISYETVDGINLGKFSIKPGKVAILPSETFINNKFK